MKSIRVPSMKVICPTAPRAPVSLNAGFEMPSWFDLKTLNISAPEDEVGIRKAADMVHGMITSEINVSIQKPTSFESSNNLFVFCLPLITLVARIDLIIWRLFTRQAN